MVESSLAKENGSDRNLSGRIWEFLVSILFGGFEVDRRASENTKEGQRHIYQLCY